MERLIVFKKVTGGGSKLPYDPGSQPSPTASCYEGKGKDKANIYVAVEIERITIWIVKRW